MPDDATTPLPTPLSTEPTIPSIVPVARPVSAEFLAHLTDPLLLGLATRRQVLLDMGVLFLLLISFEIALSTLFILISGGGGVEPFESANGEAMRPFMIPLLVLRGLAVCVLVPLIMRHRRQTRASIGLRWPVTPLDLVLGLAAPIVAYGVIVLLILSLEQLWPRTRDEMDENVERLLALIPSMNPIGYVFLALLIGVYEELLFRGFLLPRLRRATGSWTLAVVLSSALFTALHAGEQTTSALVAITILSLVFSVLTVWRRSIIPAIIAHALWDLAQFLLLYFYAGQEWT